MSITDSIASQYLASLAMLRDAVIKCPDDVWDDRTHKNVFWHVAYHALFYTHFYLQDTQDSFTPWIKHRDQSRSLKRSPQETAQSVDPYGKDSILEYLAFCEQEVAERVPHLDLGAPSGFSWLPFDKLELQIYTIRHLQQHIGELMERLATRIDTEVNWVSLKHS